MFLLQTRSLESFEIDYQYLVPPGRPLCYACDNNLKLFLHLLFFFLSKPEAQRAPKLFHSLSSDYLRQPSTILHLLRAGIDSLASSSVTKPLLIFILVFATCLVRSELSSQFILVFTPPFSEVQQQAVIRLITTSVNS